MLSLNSFTNIFRVKEFKAISWVDNKIDTTIFTDNNGIRHYAYYDNTESLYTVEVF